MSEKQLLLNIPFLRNRECWTQERLAKLVGTKKGTVGAWEEGRAIPNEKHLKRLSDIFLYTIDDLVRSDLKGNRK